ncbi:MAG: GntR family transcriptional regulator [Phycisphaerae bacterium]|nr:GntR family transcriptional regulator [Phycisphaerae bacterium]
MQESPWLMRLDRLAGVPACRQIVDTIRTVLVAGGVEAGEKLPTVRAMAEQFGVHHNTVAQAYRALAAEGFLQLKRHCGATVLKRAVPVAGPATMESFGRQLREITAKAIAAGAPVGEVAALLVGLGTALRET